MREKKDSGIDEVVKLCRALRGKDGCAWDKQQSIKSMTPYFVEEVYEFVDAADEGRRETILEELGDILFLVILASEIAREKGLFTLRDVVQFNMEKLKRRHPHVFKLRAKMAVGDVLRQWEIIKGTEKNSSTISKSMKRAEKLPSLLQAYRIQEKVSAVGFDWTTSGEIVKKIKEELLEVAEAAGRNAKRELSAEVGDLLFSVVNLARFNKIDPERCLRRATKKFVARFGYVEESMRRKGKKLSRATLPEMEACWKEVKRKTEK